MQALASDYAPATGDAALATPTCCCCCCCCCCTLVVPELAIAQTWGNTALEAYTSRRVVPPLGEVMKAYAGGFMVGNLSFFIFALAFGFFLVLVTQGVYLIVVPAALVLGGAVGGGVLGAKVGRQRGETQGGLIGALVGVGAALLGLACAVGICAIVVTAMGVIEFAPYALLGVLAVAAATWVIVEGSRARRPALAEPAQGPRVLQAPGAPGGGPPARRPPPDRPRRPPPGAP